jgi:hypothetical protein
MDAIDTDLSLIVLESEYPKLKAALTINYTEIGYDLVMMAINDISLHTFTASRLVSRYTFEYNKFLEYTYDPTMAKARRSAIEKLEAEWKEKKNKTTLTESRIADYIAMNFGNDPALKAMNDRKAKYEKDMSVLKSLHRRLEQRESLLQTYAKLQQKKFVIGGDEKHETN